MGTRGLLGFIILGQRHSAYKQYDSYPEGLGKDIVDFILGLTPEEYSTMARLVAELTWVPWRSKASLELQARYQQLGYADLNVSGQSLEDWYCLLRQTQGAVALPAIQKGELKHMIESPLETSDWEWAYFIDFENRFLETWAYGMLLDIIPFEQLVKDGVEKYVASVERYERVASGEEEDEDEEY